jgi:hypothetical protein
MGEVDAGKPATMLVPADATSTEPGKPGNEIHGILWRQI